MFDRKLILFLGRKKQKRYMSLYYFLFYIQYEFM